MSKQLFDELVAEMPPSTVDSFAIVRRERRRRVIRVVSFASGVVALTLAAGLTMIGTDTSARPSAALPGSSAAPPTQADDRFVLAAFDDQSAAASAQQLRKVWDASFHKQAPGAHWVFVPQFAKAAPGPDGQPPNLYSKVPQDAKTGQLFTGIGGIVNDGQKGYLRLVVISTLGKTPAPSLLTCHADMPHCTQGTGPDGEGTVLWTDSGNSATFTDYTVNVGLPGGRVLQMSTGNAWGGAPAAQPGTPLTGKQLLAIATDIASHIKA
jgi:hypothetical protein